MTERFSLKARYVFPIWAPPIANGTVTISGARIAALGNEAPGGPVEDLGNVALIPGLVNAHCHLDLSDVRTPLGTAGMDFVPWLRQLMEFRLSERSGQSVAQGLEESFRCGVTTLGEIALPGWPTDPVNRAALTSVVFLELIAPTAERVHPMVALAGEHLQADTAGRWRPGLGPHAPYTVHPELLAHVIALSAAHGTAVAFHLAESREEMQLLRSTSGPLRERLEELGAWQPGVLQPGTRPLDYLRSLARVPRTLVIHGNYLDDDETAFLGANSHRMSVIYCPRTHAWFNHPPYPLGEMLAAGVCVALGTDSRASSPDLDLLAEMRFAASQHPTVSLAAILRAGTLAGARALGCAVETGSLEPGKFADLAVVSLPEDMAAEPHELLLQGGGRVTRAYYRGTRTVGQA